MEAWRLGFEGGCSFDVKRHTKRDCALCAVPFLVILKDIE